MRSLFVTLLLFVCYSSFSSIAFAQTPGTQPPGGQPPVQHYTILGITVVGNRTSDAATIISQSALYNGEQISLPSDVLRTARVPAWRILVLMPSTVSAQTAPLDLSSAIWASL